MNIKKIVTKFNSQIRKLDLMKSQFCNCPGKDFTRDRKLSFESTIRTILYFGGGTLTNELLKINRFSIDTPYSSAFVQQRAKISPEAFAKLFDMVNQAFDAKSRYKGYRLMTVDGSHLHVPTNVYDPESFVKCKESERPHSEFHLNAMFDILQEVYVAAVIQKYRTQNEDQAMIEMVENSHFTNALVICDRGYESYNNMAHLQTSGWKYVIRIKEPGGNGIADGFDLPDNEEYDLSINLTLTRRKNKEVKTLLGDKNNYRYIPGRVNFDYLTREFTRKDPVQYFSLNF